MDIFLNKFNCNAWRSAFVASPAMAQFDIKLNAEAEDVSHADGNQVMSMVTANDVTIKIMSAQVIQSWRYW